MGAQAVPTVGVEEEFVLLDRALLAPVDAADRVLTRMAAAEGHGLHMAEFFASQVELATLPTTRTDELERTIRLLRTELAAVAAEQDCIAAGTGTPFDVRDGGRFSPEPRYERIAAEYGAVARDHQINGLHVHVAVPSEDAAVRGVNVLRPWLPLLLALALVPWAALARAPAALVDLQVVDRDSGTVLPQYRHGGQAWLAGEPGRDYAVRLRNLGPERVLVVLSVDGVNAVSGQTADPRQAGYVLGPW